MSESHLVKQCLQYLNLKHIDCWRNNSGALKTESGGFVRFGAMGSPDIFAFINKQLVGIECKYGKNKQSDNQKQFEKMMKKNGADYWLVYDIETFIGKLV